MRSSSTVGHRVCGLDTLPHWSARRRRRLTLKGKQSFNRRKALVFLGRRLCSEMVSLYRLGSTSCNPLISHVERFVDLEVKA